MDAEVVSKALEGMVWPSIKIYVAGPYSSPDIHQVWKNVNEAIDAGAEIMHLGHSPFIPHLTHFIEIRNKREWPRLHGFRLGYEDYMRVDQAWLEQADGLLLLGHSPGADRELAVAKELRLTIWTNIVDIPRAGSLVEKPR